MMHCCFTAIFKSLRISPSVQPSSNDYSPTMSFLILKFSWKHIKDEVDGGSGNLICLKMKYQHRDFHRRPPTFSLSSFSQHSRNDFFLYTQFIIPSGTKKKNFSENEALCVLTTEKLIIADSRESPHSASKSGGKWHKKLHLHLVFSSHSTVVLPRFIKSRTLEKEIFNLFFSANEIFSNYIRSFLRKTRIARDDTDICEACPHLLTATIKRTILRFAITRMNVER